MTRKFFAGALIALLAERTQAYIRFGACPSIEPVEDFEVERYMGRWYEIIRDKLTPFQFLAECTNVDYALIEGQDGRV